MSRKLVYETLEFSNPKRLPRDPWTLPWAKINHPNQVQKIIDDYPSDIKTAGQFNGKSPIVKGVYYEIGQYTDQWGCVFENIQRGVIGEVRNPIIVDETWNDLSKVHFPYEWKAFDINDVNAYCKSVDKFVLSGFIARPFERLQFLRGTENLYIDLMVKPDGMMEFIKKLHEYNISVYEKWAKTDVDGLFMMDDWGAQNNLLINPDL